MVYAKRGTDKWIRENTCPKCGKLVELHWTLAMTPEELEGWHDDRGVCALTRSEVLYLIGHDEGLGIHEAEPERMSTCALCGGEKVANPKSKFFTARPEQETDLEWDGCEQGSGT